MIALPEKVSYSGAWIAGALGLVVYLFWSFLLAFLIDAVVGSNNDFWASGHFGFTLITALPIAIACACLWGFRGFGNSFRRACVSTLILFFAIIAFSITLRPGYETLFVLVDFLTLAIGPIVLFSTFAAFWYRKRWWDTIDEQSDADEGLDRPFLTWVESTPRPR
jgi:hypothetical protein